MFFTRFSSFIPFIILLFFVIWILFFLYFKKKKIISPYFFLLFSFFCLVLSFFNPHIYSNHLTKTTNTSFVFLIDVSKSMNVEDIQYDNWNISRLEAVKKFISDFVAKNPYNNYALCIFAWESLRILPFTQDVSLFNTFLDGITNKNISKNGTDFKDAFSSAFLNFTNDKAWWTIITFTDGGDEKTNFSLPENIKRDKNIHFLTFWIGTEKWWYIPIGVDVFWEKIYKTYAGEMVISKLIQSNIENIAHIISWKYDFLSTFSDFSRLEKSISKSAKYSQNEKQENEKSIKKECLILAFLFFVLYLFFLFLDKKLWKKS